MLRILIHEKREMLSHSMRTYLTKLESEVRERKADGFDFKRHWIEHEKREITMTVRKPKCVQKTFEEEKENINIVQHCVVASFSLSSFLSKHFFSALRAIKLSYLPVNPLSWCVRLSAKSMRVHRV